MEIEYSPKRFGRFRIKWTLSAFLAFFSSIAAINVAQRSDPASPPPPPDRSVWREVGIEPSTTQKDWVMVERVGEPACFVDIREGDVIERMNGRAVSSIADAEREIRQSPETIGLDVRSHGKEKSRHCEFRLFRNAGEPAGVEKH